MTFAKITNAQIKHIRLLQLKKYRQKYDQFIVEGFKSVNEFIQSERNCLGIYGNEEALISYEAKVAEHKCFITTSNQLERISNFKNNSGVLAVFETPKTLKIDTSASLLLALDDIRDPGNLGTIIRTAEWFGLRSVICSKSSVDCYNPKVIQASMGSLARMKIIYTDLAKFIKDHSEFNLVLADMDGVDYKTQLVKKDILVIGNEANGVSSYLKELDHQKVTIPSKGGGESLNAAISTAIILSAWA